MKKTLLLVLTALLTAMTAWASTFTVTNSDNTFTITRSSSSGTETVCYRTVGLSAIGGVHFTDAVGTLNFLDGESVKTVTVTETPIDSIAVLYKFQTGTTRTYRFEVLDPNGILLDNIDRDITFGSEYQYTVDYMNRSITDLVYFDDDGNINSDSGNNYLDVAYSSTDWIKVTDAGYPQGVHTISTDDLYHGNSALRTYLNNINDRMYATVFFTQKEEADGYQYIQILADNSTTFDDNDTWGEVYDPSISIYKACFELSLTGDYSADEHYQFFPHRYDYVNKDAEIAADLSRYSFDYDNSYFYEQKYQSSDYDAPNTGSLNLATTVNELNIRFDAGGNSTDDWDFKDLKVRLALVDNTDPTALDNLQVSGGPYWKGNTIYVSVPFSEIVDNPNNLGELYTTWGTLNYYSGNGTNVLTFSGTISDNASGNFAVTNYGGDIYDLANNSLNGTISHNFNICLTDSIYYITYDLAGGTLPEGQSNPETYTPETATFTLVNPTRPTYTFIGWTGSNGDTPQTVVTIEQGSGGDRSYTANWYRPDPYYTFDSETGALALILGEFNKDNKWGDEVTNTAVKSVTATSDVSFTGDCSHLFEDFKNCESINLSNVNTSKMTKANSMFRNCWVLTSLDVSSFNTDSVTDMNYMFTSCWVLPSLDVSSFNTANVTDMSYMFAACMALTSLDVTGFNTRNVTDMSYMFNNCKSLTSLDLSSFNTAKVTNMRYMFPSCLGLTSLDFSGFNTANVTDMSGMFADCTYLTTIYVSEEWSTEKVTESSFMFHYCMSLVGEQGTTYNNDHKDAAYAHIDGGNDNPGYFTYKWSRYTFDGETGALALNWGKFNKDDKWGSRVVAENVKSVTTTNDVSFTGDCSHLFEDFSNCESINLSNVNTSQMTNAAYMFNNCSGLTTLNLSGFNTGNVMDMSYMFYNCKGLPSLDVSGFNTANVTDMRYMFYNCKGLTSLDVSGFNTGNVTDMRYMFYNCSGLTALDVSGFNTANVTDMRYMFNNCSGLTALDVSGFNTANVTDMGYMFYNLSGLTALDVSGFNTANVTDMGYMFNNCSGLTALDVSGFKTGNVTDMNYMFCNCSGLTALDVSGFNTANATSMGSMFAGCKGLTSLDVWGFNTGNVSDMGWMFYGCAGLTSLDLSRWNTGNITYMPFMFYDCSGLTSLDISGFNTAKVTDMRFMFYDCSRVTTIYAGEGWNTEKVRNSDYMFYDCIALEGGMGTTYDENYTDKTYARIDGGPSDPGYLTYRAPHYTFDSETGALALIWGEFNENKKWGNDVVAANVKSVTATNEVSFTGDCSSLFKDFRNCDSINLSNVNTSEMTNAAYMFYNCWDMTSLDISGFNTAKVTDMHGMFASCSSLTSLDVTGFNTAKVTDMRGMFNSCSSLTTLDLSGFNTDSVTDMSWMFAGSGGLTSLDLSGWNTANVTKMNTMFDACTGLTSLDLSSWNTANVTDMWSMFTACTHLTTIYAGEDWSTENVYYATTLFSACLNLVGGMGTTFSWSHLAIDYAHIDGGPENPGYFTAKSTVLRGDVNGDGEVDINDVTILIDYLLGTQPQNFNEENANVNGGVIDISDVTTLIDYLLRGVW